MPAPIEVFFWTTPNGWKITLALEEMELPYVIRPAVQRGMAAGADLRRPTPAPGSDEQGEFARALFGQTAATIAELHQNMARGRG